MTELSASEREAMQAFQEQQWTPVPIPPIAAQMLPQEWSQFHPMSIMPVANEELVIDCKVNDPDYFNRFMACGFQLTNVKGEKGDDGQWHVRAVFTPIPSR